MRSVVVTGSQGFIGGYLCRELLGQGYEVIGIDNFSKYGRVNREHDKHRGFTLVETDLSTEDGKGALRRAVDKYQPEAIIAGAAMIGGISYFHKYAYDLLATNDRITANTVDIAIEFYKRKPKTFKRLVMISSSMIYEGADLELKKLEKAMPGIDSYLWPSRESESKCLPSPNSTYGFQKLATEYYCKGAHEQYGLPYTIVRPFNCVGLGEEDAQGDEEILSGNVKLMLSHVLPDLVNKCLKGQDPLHLLGDGSQVRCYTHGKDIARGIICAMQNPKGLNESFNISTSRYTTVLQLAKLVWSKINLTKPFSVVYDEPYQYDVQKRIPDVSKAKELLGFEAKIPLEVSVDEIVRHMRKI